MQSRHPSTAAAAAALRKGEWSLEAGLAQELMHRWGRCTVDRFADALSAQLRRFNAPYPRHGCEAVDAFSVSWTGERS